MLKINFEIYLNQVLKEYLDRDIGISFFRSKLNLNNLNLELRLSSDVLETYQKLYNTKKSLTMEDICLESLKFNIFSSNRISELNLFFDKDSDDDFTIVYCYSDVPIQNLRDFFCDKNILVEDNFFTYNRNNLEELLELSKIFVEDEVALDYFKLIAKELNIDF